MKKLKWIKNKTNGLEISKYNEEVMTMAIILCPECRKEVSDKANICVHCGFPLKEYLRKAYSTCTVDGVPRDLSYILDAKTEEDRRSAALAFKSFAKCSTRQAKKVVDYIRYKQVIPKVINTRNIEGKTDGEYLDVEIIERDKVVD